jgi:putative oxidoreductase
VRIVEIVARYLLGIIFTVFGLNGFLNFIHQLPPPNPLASQFFIAISASHFSVSSSLSNS